MVRVISGSLKNRSIYYGKILAIRPTQDRVKSAMFSIIGELGGCKVADLFAGTGNLGIEALSRGATSCTFVEIESHNSALIRQNLLTLGLEKDTEIVRTDVLKFLADMPQFDLILADPPYQYAHYSELLRSFSRLKSGTRVMLETDYRFRIPADFTPSDLKIRRSGDTNLNYFRI